jgi:hypothetical protein
MVKKQKDKGESLQIEPLNRETMKPLNKYEDSYGFRERFE